MSIDRLHHGENHIRSVVLFQVMWNLVEGSTRVRVPRTGAGTRAAGMWSDARQVQAKPRVPVIIKAGVRSRGWLRSRLRIRLFSRTSRQHVT